MSAEQLKQGRVRFYVAVDDEEAVEVKVGAFAQIAAKRQFGMDAIKSDDPEALLFAIWVERNGRPPKDNALEAFDQWLESVSDFRVEQDGGGDDVDPPSESNEPSLDSQ